VPRAAPTTPKAHGVISRNLSPLSVSHSLSSLCCAWASDTSCPHLIEVALSCLRCSCHGRNLNTHTRTHAHTSNRSCSLLSLPGHPAAGPSDGGSRAGIRNAFTRPHGSRSRRLCRWPAGCPEIWQIALALIWQIAFACVAALHVLQRCMCCSVACVTVSRVGPTQSFVPDKFSLMNSPCTRAPPCDPCARAPPCARWGSWKLYVVFSMQCYA